MKKFPISLIAALLLTGLSVAPGCSRPEYPPTATPQIRPITPAARTDLADDAFAGWSLAEREAALFIQGAPVYFYYDSAALSDSAKAVLDQKAEVIKTFPQFSVLIGGHCDERGTAAYNYGLGGRRAKAVRDYLIQRGVPAAQLDVASYGKGNPQAPGRGEAAWSRNRRAEFTVSRR